MWLMTPGCFTGLWLCAHVHPEKGAFCVTCRFTLCALTNRNWRHVTRSLVCSPKTGSPPAEFPLPLLEFIKGETLLTERTGGSIQRHLHQIKRELRYKSETNLSWFKLCNLFSLLVLWPLVCPPYTPLPTSSPSFAITQTPNTIYCW